MRVTFNGKPAVALIHSVGNFNIVPIKLDSEFRSQILQFSHNSIDESLCAISVELQEGEDLFTGTEVGNLLKEKQDEIAELQSEINCLEKLRPHWAKGYSSDSIAAQCKTTALNQLWELLGVEDQTQAVLKLKEVLRDG